MSSLVRAGLVVAVLLGALACHRDAGGSSGGGGGNGGGGGRSGARIDGGPAWPAWPADFAPYPGARRLCAGRSPAGLLRERWATYASADEPAAVTGFYARAHGGDPAARPFVARGRGTTSLAIHAAADTDYPRCATAPAAGERSVILVTTAAPRFAPDKEIP